MVSKYETDGKATLSPSVQAQLQKSTVTRRRQAAMPSRFTWAKIGTKIHAYAVFKRGYVERRSWFTRRREDAKS